MKTFSLGGIHPHDNKISKESAVEVAPLPKVAVIYLSQHIGAPATALVAKGDTVKVGDIIGQANGFVSANIHSSVSGTVAGVDNVVDGGGLKKMAVTINVEGEVWNESIDRSENIVAKCDLEPKEIIDRVAKAGIVGLGGATFPCHVKLSVPAGKRAEALVINGVECEPYLTADHRLMLEKGEQIIIGCKILMKAVGVDKCYIGIENNKPDAIESLRRYAGDGIEIVPLKMQYPQGGEKQLIDAVMGRKVPSGALPIEVGAVVQNVGTVYAVYEAVQKGKPLFERVVTVTGKQLSNPRNLLVRVGTSIEELIAFCGGEPDDTAKVVNGGPMMGRAMSNVASATTKGTSGVLLFGSKEGIREKASECISCAKCVDVCPMGLEPYLLSKISKAKLFDRLEKEKITDCIECGCCQYTCPAYLPLLDYIRLGKAETIKLIRNRK